VNRDRPKPPWWGKEVLSTREAAEYLGYTTRTLRNWRSVGYGPRYFRPSTKTGWLRYKREDLDEFLRTVPPLGARNPSEAA
jgi:hypothetical protein